MTQAFLTLSHLHLTTIQRIKGFIITTHFIRGKIEAQRRKATCRRCPSLCVAEQGASVPCTLQDACVLLGPLGVRLDIAVGHACPQDTHSTTELCLHLGHWCQALPASGLMVPAGNTQKRCAWGSGMSRARLGAGDVCVLLFALALKQSIGLIH